MRSERLLPSGGVLVTGAGGVLGRSLLPLLYERFGDDSVVAPSRLELDLTNREAVQDYIGRLRPSIVVHLASLVFGLAGNLRNQALSLETNTRINDSLFSALRLAPPEHVFFAGTVASYPYPYPSLPLKESEFFLGLPHRGEFGYAMAKRHAYPYLSLLETECGVPFTYGILTNLYGSGDRFDVQNGHVIPSLVAKAHAASRVNSALSVWGDGRAERDFLHASDAADAIMLCIQTRHNGLINISSGLGVSIGQVARILGSIAGLSSVEFDETKPTGIPSRIVDNSALRKLGFSIGVPIDVGLEQTYRWYAENESEARK